MITDNRDFASFLFIAFYRGNFYFTTSKLHWKNKFTFQIFLFKYSIKYLVIFFKKLVLVFAIKFFFQLINSHAITVRYKVTQRYENEYYFMLKKSLPIYKFQQCGILNRSG